MSRIRAVFSLVSLVLTSAVVSSCVTTKNEWRRDPASVAEACGGQPSYRADLAKLPSQVLARLEAQEVSAAPSERIKILQAEYDRLTLMITKSRVYSDGMEESPDPRVILVRRAIALIESEASLKTNDAVKTAWNEDLYLLEPSLRPNPTDLQVQAKAGGLIRKNQTAEARTLLKGLSENKSALLAQRLSARLDLLKSFRFQGSDDEFLKQLESHRGWFRMAYFTETVHSPDAIKAYSSFQQALIRGHVKKEKFARAEKEIAKLQIFLTTEHQSPAGAEWMQGRVYELRGRFADARAAYESALTHLPSDDISKDQLLWQIGWENYRLGHSDESLQSWAQLPTTGVSQMLARNLFWSGKAQAKAGRTAQAKSEYQLLLQTYPGTFYYALALRELGLQMPHLPFRASSCELLGIALSRMKLKYSSDDVAAFATFYRNHDAAGAKRFLMDLSISEGFDSSLMLASAAVGDYQPLVIGFNKLTLAEQSAILREVPEVLFPNPYEAIVNRESRRNTIDPYFVNSTIRQESVFAPYSLSFADARGLMQVMPQLGVKYSKAQTLPSYSVEQLYEPGLNIAIGVKVLKAGFESHRESYILTLAGYNAGDEIAAIWDRHLSRDPLEFIEEIPFSETNGYVKAILRNEIYNRALYGEEKGFEFPEGLLKR